VARFDLKAWARIGAQRRLEEIREERRSIHIAFPDLRGGGSEVGSGRKGSGRKGGIASARAGSAERVPSANRSDGGETSRRKRFKMSAKARRAISLAMKRRWRKVKAAKKASG
jgi:hypothetical protein